ncbi:DUF1240 domain-containing protein [Providencia hangzhouensis]
MVFSCHFAIKCVYFLIYIHPIFKFRGKNNFVSIFYILNFFSPFTLYLSFIFYRAAKSSSEIKLNNQIFKYLLFIAIIGLLISLIIFIGMKSNLLSKGYIRCTDKSSTMVTTYTIDKALCKK